LLDIRELADKPASTMNRMLIFILLCTSVFMLSTPSQAARTKVYSPTKKSAEYKRIFQVIHDGEHVEMYKILKIKVAHASDQRSIAYVEYQNPIGWAQVIMTREGTEPWKDVWGESDGGSGSCIRGAAHYAWAIEFIQTYGVKPDALFPGLTKATAQIQKEANGTDIDYHCVGDLFGGAE
jgi:hypothetical protein